MSEQLSIEAIRKSHEELYETVLKQRTTLLKNDRELDALLDKVSKLLDDINLSSKHVSTVDDYRWLSNIATKWQVVFSSIFNIPKTIEISLPPDQLVQPLSAEKALSENELNIWIKRYAEYMDLLRLAQYKRRSSPDEIASDWRRARALLASDILDGFPNFAGRIASTSYKRLEDVWLEDVKLLRAYFLWERRGDGLDPIGEKNDYSEVCEYLRRMLVNPGIKALPTEFGEAKAYLEDNYLSNGKLDRDKPSATMLIAKKAERIGEMAGKVDVFNDWLNAELYVKMFYESIIPAVMEDDREKVLIVLKAFQYSIAPENHWEITNCFETALATYFLKPETIQSLWHESAGKLYPESSIQSSVAVQSWPITFSVPKECKHSFMFDRNENRITFKGVMTELQKSALLNKVSEREHIDAINSLFTQSRLIQRGTTL